MSDKILEAVEGLGKQLTENKSATQALIETKFTEAEKIAKEFNQKIEDEVKTINEDMAKKGATLEQIQKEVKDLKAARGRFSGGEGVEENNTAVIIAEAFEEHFAEIKAFKKGSGPKFEMKAAGTMTAANNLSGNIIATYDLTPQVRGRRRINIRDLLPVINSTTGLWKFYRQRIPVGEGSFGFQITHGNTKNQLDYDLDEINVNAEYLSGFALVAKQMMQDLPFLQNFVANELVEDYKRQESAQFFGLLTAGATGSATTSSSVLAEKYIDWIATLMGNDWYANAIVTDSTNWATILKTKPNDYNVPGGITIAADGTVMFVGIPLIAQNNIGAGHTLIGDFTKAAIIQTEGLSAEFFEQDGNNVRQNLITARVEARVGLGILRPDAFIFS